MIGLEAQPRVYKGPCPTVIKFVGSIETGGPSTVKYVFDRNDGANDMNDRHFTLTAAAFIQADSRVRGQPMKRAKLRGVKRNAAVVLGNVGTHEEVDVLTRSLRDEEPLVREHASWALARLADYGS